MKTDDSKPDPLDRLAADWQVRHQRGLSATEQHQLDEWLQADPCHLEAYRRAERAWQITALFRDDPAFARPPRRRPLRWLAAAAVTLMLLPLAWQHGTQLWLSLSSDYQAEAGQVREVHLDDGSRVLLGSRAAIRVEYDAELRRVHLLHGEALFEPAARQGQERRAFRVLAGNVAITALGTRYLVRREASDKLLVAVLEHQVEVVVPGLSPAQVDEGQSLEHDPASGLHGSNRDPLLESSWSRGVLSFREQPLDSLLDRLNQYRGKPILLLRRELAGHPLSALLRLDNLDNAPLSLSSELGLKVMELPGVTLLY